MLEMRGIFVILILPFVLVAAKNTYIVTVPKQIRAGSVANVCVNILRRGFTPTEITAKLMTNDDITLSEETGQVTHGKLEVIKLAVPSNAKANSNYKIRVSATGFVKFTKTARNIRLTEKASSIFIQLSRPLYKPGDLVQFRVFGIFPNLKAVKYPMDIIIYDPNRNRIKQFLGVQPSNYVFGGDLQLSPLTTDGNWRVEVKQLREKVSKTFEVKEFVLPKFEVNVVVPSQQLVTDEYFIFTINAIYTFGKPVVGEAKVILGYRWASNARKITKTFKTTGRDVIKILMREVQPRLGNYIPIFVEVTEGVTGNKVNATANARIYTYPEKMQFSQNQPRIFKPGLSYTAILRVTNQDNTPLSPPTGLVNITAYYDVYKQVSPKKKLENHFQEERRFQPRCPPLPPTEQRVLFEKRVNIPKDGVILVKALFPEDAVRGRIQARYRKTSAFLYLQRAGSASNNFLQITIKDGTKTQPGNPLRLTLKGTERIGVCYFKVFAKGSLVKKGRFIGCLRPNGANNKKILISAEMAPKATLLVYYVRRRTGEVVAASVTFVIEDVFKNKVKIRFNKKRVLPAENVKLEISADPYSMVNVLAVDKSILLLKTGHDITVENVLNELQRYSSSSPIFRRWGWRRPWIVAAKDAFAVFDGAGVYVLTDANLYQYQELPQQVSFRRSFARRTGVPGRGPEGAAGVVADAARSGGGLAQPQRVRTFFPETWIWQNVTTGARGKATINEKAPDTITEWIASAFSVSAGNGLGVAAQQANLTTFQKFFVRLELPAVAIRGEILLLQCSIFNYNRPGSQVVVQMDKSDAFDFSDKDGNVVNPSGPGLIETIFVRKDGVESVVFPIILRKVGDVKIKVTARTRSVADAVERALKVKAEGIEQNYNIPVLIDLRGGGSIQTDFTITYPPNVIDDSQFIKVQVIGDIMAQTLTNIENLVRQSYGCGEQNMLRFAPNAFVGAYLKTTNRLTPDIDAKLNRVLEKGYQIQIVYLRNDGSFSAFGKSDPTGSTWLTAFVVKSFAQASDLTYIDPNIMERSITYLLDRQLPSGEFGELGIVRHKAMQGGSISSKKSLTAFVLIALLECRNYKQISNKIMDRANKAIDLSVSYVRDGAPASLKNLYELIIVLYALTLAKESSIGPIYNVMAQKAVNQGGERYWTIPSTESQIINPWRGWRPPNSNTRALDIEITAYALLIYNIRGETLNGMRVLKWLGKQRNGNGGFISTQDTVVALQALAGLAERLYSPNFDLQVFVGADGWNGKDFKVDNTNSLVLQSVDVPNPKSVSELSVDASGRGLCVLQATVYYNVPRELRQPAFELKVTVLKDSINGFTLRICFRWLRQLVSTMGYLEVYEPTGMKADISSIIHKDAPTYKKIESDFRKANIFFDYITSKEMCIELDIKRRDLVARHKPVPVQISEYYESSNTEKVLYASNALKDATIIEVCGNTCRLVKK